MGKTMGDDKEAKEALKTEKKRIKALQKIEKKKAKAQDKESKMEEGTKENTSGPEKDDSGKDQSRLSKNDELTPGIKADDKVPVIEIKDKPWYKNPDWIRALIAIGSLVIGIITLFVTLKLS